MPSLGLSCPTASLLDNIEVAHIVGFGYFKAIQQAIGLLCLRDPSDWKRKPRLLLRHPALLLHTPTYPPPVWLLVCPREAFLNYHALLLYVPCI